MPEHLAALPRPDLPAAADQPATDQQVLVEDRDVAAGAMAQIMPWVISGFFHLGILVILAFLTLVLMPTVEAEPAGIPDPTVTFGEASGGPIDSGSDRTDRQMQSTKLTDMKDFVERSDGRIVIDRRGKTDKKVKVIGPLGEPGDGKDVSGLLRRGDDKPTFRPPWDSGRPVSAYHVVYLIDHSGSMLESLDLVKKELIRSITHLRPNLGQSFHALFFSDGKPLENPPRRLVPATEDRKREAAKFLHTVRAMSTTGRTDPLAAVERAFQVLRPAPNDKKGKVIYLLTDGEFCDSRKVVETIRKLNAGREVRIYTTLYGYRSSAAARVLKQIAEESGGRYTFIESR